MKPYHNIFTKIIVLFIFLSPICTKSDESSGPWLEIADLMKLRDYNAVVDKLGRYAKESNQVEHRALIYFQIGSVYLEYIHDYAKAMDTFQNVLNLKKSVNAPSQDFFDYVALSQMSIADIYRRTGRYDKAIDEYSEVIRSFPKTRYAKIASEDIKGINNALAEIDFYRKVIAEQPNTDISAEIQLEIADLYLSPQNLNNPEQAIKEYEKFIENYTDNPKSLEAQFKIADTYRSSLRDPQKSISAYQKLFEMKFLDGSLDAEAMFQIGIIYYSDLHNYKMASDVFAKFLSEYPVYWKYPAGVYWQGMCFERLENYDDAIKCFELFVQLYPDGESKLSADIGKLGERDVKLQIKAKVDELKKIAPSIKWNQAEQLVSSGKYREALSTYRELMSEYPNTDYAENAKIQARKIENLAEIQALREIISKKDESAPYAQYKIGEIFETEVINSLFALKEYQMVVDNYSGTYWAGEALLRMGILYSESGNMRLTKVERRSRQSIKPDYAKAIAVYQRLIKEYPNSYRSAEAHYRLGEIYRVNLNDYDKALSEYEKVISNYPKKSFYEREGYKDSLADQAQFKIGKIYYENLKDNDKALEVFTKFLSDYPDSCRKAAVYSYLFVIYEAKRDYDSAATSLEVLNNIIIDSSVQSLYFIRDSVSDIRPSESMNSNSDLQHEITKQIRLKVSQMNRK